MATFGKSVIRSDPQTSQGLFLAMTKAAYKQTKKSDYFSAGKPVHRLSYCAFLDVLGFSERIRDSYTDGGADTLLETFHQILAKSIAQIRESTDESMLYFKSFTDNVVLAHPRFSDDMESEFGFILWSINEYQFQMALKGFFIRGGLAVDQLFMDENSVYGAALLEAYRLESKVAVNPIVVLCDNTMKLVDMHIGYYAGEVAPQVRDVLKGPDGRYFLNYLTECIIEGDDREYLNADSLRLHKQQIESALKSYVAVPVVFSKFSWLTAYHNYFCDMVSTYPEYDDSLRVSAAYATIQFQRLAKKKKK
ncbi:hypothetical protein [Burkholderia sp. JKS000303]|uniref:hypothetical protein n=1 Tax=Burkholderia sp. JKS000303 TaxID=1938747 RepID=UPI000C006425|nr:hypothetical protein [Burkholderia sp. JKS000303]PFH13337.1 hypothetical protein BX604_6867 [Burkholderia sp. JKS000303]